MVTMAATDESCSPAVLYTSEELGNTSPNTFAAGISQNKLKAGHINRTVSSRTVPSVMARVPKPKRAKLEPKRGEQVANIRKK